MKNRILLIDDDPLVRESFKKLLMMNGYKVILASAYDEALKAIEKGNFNLILSDIRMPGKNGVETITEIQASLGRAGKKDLPIIFITGFAEYGQELHANFLGEVLYKPIDNEKLLTAIRDYL